MIDMSLLGNPPLSAPGVLSSCIFQEPWWLDIVAPGSWEEILINNTDGVVARWPFVKKERLGLRFITYPVLTPRMGPTLLIKARNPAERTAAIRGMLQELITKLPSHNFLDQNLTPEMDYWLPFLWSGFDVTPRCTYQLKGLSDQDALWKGMRDTLRNSIKKAQKSVVVESSGTLSELISCLRMTFDRQHMNLPFPESLIETIVTESRRRSRGEIFVAKDAKQRLHAAAFIVWDETSAFYLLGGADSNLRSSGALPLLLWASIQSVSKHVNCFDFEGSHIEPIERFFSSFGAKPTTFFRVSRMDSRARLVTLGRKLFTRLRHVR